MDMELLATVAPIHWIPDRLKLADIKPRHVGRVVTFDYITQEHDFVTFGGDPALDETVQVIGTLEGAVGDEIIVSGETFEYDKMIDLRVWRREVRK